MLLMVDSVLRVRRWRRRRRRRRDGARKTKTPHGNVGKKNMINLAHSGSGRLGAHIARDFSTKNKSRKIRNLKFLE